MSSERVIVGPSRVATETRRGVVVAAKGSRKGVPSVRIREDEMT